MRVTHSTIDLESVQKALSQPRSAPAVGVRRKTQSERWAVAVGPIEAGKPISTSLVKTEDVVLIPLVGYPVQESSPVNALAMAASLGFMLASHLRENMPAKRLHIALCPDVEHMENDVCRVYIGFGVEL